jgi:N-acyl-D-aspartate/D-glutamate deacylase
VHFDTLIRRGTVVDGTRAPRFVADVGIRDGRIAAIGQLGGADAARVIEADGLVVAPGFVDLHTHYDAQIFWDPYCTISGWHGVTTVVLGNCGGGFAPVRPDMRERMMLSLTRVEAIPLASMQAALPWDWQTFPEFMDSLRRTPKGINVMSYLPLGAVLVWVLGLDGAKAGRVPTPTELAEIRRILHEAMDAGAAGWSAQRLPPHGGIGNQRDFDGTPMPTDNMSNELAVALAEVLAERNQGFIQMNLATGDPKADGAHFAELARVSGRPVLYNVVQTNDFFPHRHRNILKFLERCRREGLRVYGQAHMTAAGLTWTFEDWNLFDDSDAWMEATTGTVAEKHAKLADPARRDALRTEVSTGVIGPMENITVLKTVNPALHKYNDLLLGEIAEREGKHPVDVMLDIAVADDLRATFYADSFTNSLDLLREVVTYPHTIYGTSDGGAHTKFITSGRYPTETIVRFVRENAVIELEEAHYRLSAFPAYLAGLRDRGVLAVGNVADIVVYDYENLQLQPQVIAHDVPGGEWRRVQGADGYRYTLVAGEVTFVDGECTGALPGAVLGPAADVATDTGDRRVGAAS